MADFQEQTMGITGLTIDASSTAPSRAEFSTFLNDGVIDVTDRHLRMRPSDDHLFLAVSDEQNSQGLDLNGARVTSVVRESGTNNDWRECSKIHPSKQGQAVASGSIHLATTHNPVYTILDNGGISVFPAPDSDPDTFKVYYVNNSPAETDGTALDHASTGIKYFPNDKVHLVILYASIKSLQSSLSDVDISTFSSKAVVPSIPIAPSISSTGVSAITIASLPTAPSYVPPSVQSDSGGIELTQVTQLDAENTIDDYDGNAIEFDQWWSTLTHLIEGAEDTELAAATLQKIQAYIGAYSAQMQNNLNTFNEANAVYQAGVQRNLEQARIDMQDAQKEADLTLQASIQDYSQTLQKFSSDIQKYQADVGKEVQAYQQELAEKTSEYQWKVGRLQDLKQEYYQAFSNPQQQNVR
jgi:hypothetical protein